MKEKVKKLFREESQRLRGDSLNIFLQEIIVNDENKICQWKTSVNCLK